MTARFDAIAESWAAFFEAEQDGLTAYATALVGSIEDARDLIQDVMVRLVSERRSVESARVYVLRCLRNGAIDRIRRRRREGREATLLAGAEFIDTTAAVVELRETAERVRQALAELTSAQREVIVLRMYAGRTLRESAEILDQPMGTVASHYARGIEKLRSLLSKELNHEA